MNLGKIDLIIHHNNITGLKLASKGIPAVIIDHSYIFWKKKIKLSKNEVIRQFELISKCFLIILSFILSNKNSKILIDSILIGIPALILKLIFNNFDYIYKSDDYFTLKNSPLLYFIEKKIISKSLFLLCHSSIVANKKKNLYNLNKKKVQTSFLELSFDKKKYQKRKKNIAIVGSINDMVDTDIILKLIEASARANLKYIFKFVGGLETKKKEEIKSLINKKFLNKYVVFYKFEKNILDINKKIDSCFCGLVLNNSKDNKFNSNFSLQARTLFYLKSFVPILTNNNSLFLKKFIMKTNLGIVSKNNIKSYLANIEKMYLNQKSFYNNYKKLKKKYDKKNFIKV